jgi:phage terminase large subunit-like protein
MEQKPSVGRIVHYQSYNENGECAYAAIITQVNADETVDITTFGPSSIYIHHGVKFSPEPKASHWNWPPRT